MAGFLQKIWHHLKWYPPPPTMDILEWYYYYYYYNLSSTMVVPMVMISLEHDLWSLWFKLVSLGGWLLKLDQLNGFKGFVGTS